MSQQIKFNFYKLKLKVKIKNNVTQQKYIKQNKKYHFTKYHSQHL